MYYQEAGTKFIKRVVHYSSKQDKVLDQFQNRIEHFKADTRL